MSVKRIAIVRHDKSPGWFGFTYRGRFIDRPAQPYPWLARLSAAMWLRDLLKQRREGREAELLLTQSYELMEADNEY